MASTPQQRSMQARMAVHLSWAATTDRSARTEPARRASLAAFDRQADPDGVLSPEERSRRAEHLRKAHYQRMALASAKARARRSVPTGSSDPDAAA